MKALRKPLTSAGKSALSGQSTDMGPNQERTFVEASELWPVRGVDIRFSIQIAIECLQS
jgi:hypothetical protein